MASTRTNVSYKKQRMKLCTTHHLSITNIEGLVRTIMPAYMARSSVPGCKGLHLYSEMTTGHNRTYTRYIIMDVLNDSVVRLRV